MEIAKKKAIQAKLSNIEFINSGFLTYEHHEPPVDIIISTAAFHHLPDFWKVIALLKMGKILKVNGILFLSDVIFSFEPTEYASEVNTFLNGIKINTDAEFYNDGILHIKEEFSTFDWLMDEMFEHTGFNILNKLKYSKTNIDYVGSKK